VSSGNTLRPETAMLNPEVRALIDRVRSKQMPTKAPGKSGSVRRCCGAPRPGPHFDGCPNQPKHLRTGKSLPKSAKKKDFSPPDGTWIRLRRVEGVWSGSMQLPDGTVIEAEDRDPHWVLDLLDARAAT